MAKGPQLIDISGRLAGIQDSVNANADLAQAKVDLNTTKNDNSSDIIKKNYEITRDQLNVDLAQIITNGVLSLADTTVQYGSQMYSLLKDKDIQTVNAQIDTSLIRVGEEMNKSLAAGTSGYVEDEEGNLQFRVAPEVQKAYDDSVAAINDLDVMKSVKDGALLSFESGFNNLRYNASVSALEQAYSDRNQLFSQNLSAALVSDAQLLANSGGVLPAGSGLSGVALIEARTDWSQDLKDAKALEYTNQVMAQAAIELGSKVAVSQGAQAALEYINNMPGLTVQQRQTAYAYAKNSIADSQSSLAASAVTMMETAIQEGSSPADVYSVVYDNLQGVAPETKSYVYGKMKSAQMAAVTEIATTQYTQDMTGGLEELQKTYDSYKSGEFGYLFEEIPEVEQTFVALYEEAINKKTSELATALNATSKDIEDADSALLETLDNTEANIMARIEANTLSPHDGIALYGETAAQIAGQLQLSDNRVAQQTAQIEFLAKLADGYLPANWKTPINDALDGVYAALEISGSTNSLTDEQIAARNSITQYSFGLIADMFYSNSDYTLDDALVQIQELKESYLMAGVAGDYSGPEVPAAEDGKTVAKNTSAAIDLFNSYRHFAGLVYSDDGAAMIQNEVNGIPAAPQYRFISEAVEENFNNGARALMPIIAAFSGEDISTITYAPEALADGTMVACPIYYAGGEAYRIRSEQIQAYRDGTWVHAGFVSTKEDEVRSQGEDFRERQSRIPASGSGNPGGDGSRSRSEDWYSQHDPGRNQTSVREKSPNPYPEADNPTDAGFKGITRDRFSQMLHADISVFDGIETREEAIEKRDEILDVYNSPMLMYEMDDLIRKIWGK